MNMTNAVFIRTCVALILGWLVSPVLAEAPLAKQVTVNGTELSYIDQGQGRTVVFVHGAFSDYRVWESQRHAIASRHRFVAMNQRYFGEADWSDAGDQYSIVTHTSDLAAFIRALDVGPVYLVGRSYGGTIALRTAMFFPEWVKGVVAQEPTIAFPMVTDAEREILKRERAGLAPAKRAATSGDIKTATRLFADWTNNQPGGFAALAPELRKVHLDNGRTIPLHFQAPRPPKITCKQLGAVQAPVVITTGAETRPFFKVLAERANQCLSNARLVPIANARHAATSQNPDAFNEVLLNFLVKH